MSIRSCYAKAISGMTISPSRAIEAHNLMVIKELKANELPAFAAEFVEATNAGSDFLYSLSLIHSFHQEGIACYLAKIPEKKGVNYFAVLYIDEHGNKHLANPTADIKNGTSSRLDNRLEQYIVQRAFIYDLYGLHGNEIFFTREFAENCKIAI